MSGATIRLTPGEARIVAHRLEAADAVADALEEEFPRDAVEDRCDALLRGWSDGEEMVIEIDDPLTAAVVRDACEGSTFLASVGDGVGTGEIGRGEFLAAHRAAASLSRKVGVEVERS